MESQVSSSEGGLLWLVVFNLTLLFPSCRSLQVFCICSVTVGHQNSEGRGQPLQLPLFNLKCNITGLTTEGDTSPKWATPGPTNNSRWFTALLMECVLPVLENLKGGVKRNSLWHLVPMTDSIMCSSAQVITLINKAGWVIFLAEEHYILSATPASCTSAVSLRLPHLPSPHLAVLRARAAPLLSLGYLGELQAQVSVNSSLLRVAFVLTILELMTRNFYSSYI